MLAVDLGDPGERRAARVDRVDVLGEVRLLGETLQ